MNKVGFKRWEKIEIVTMSELRPASCEGGAVGARKDSPLPRSNIWDGPDGNDHCLFWWKFSFCELDYFKQNKDLWERDYALTNENCCVCPFFGALKPSYLVKELHIFDRVAPIWSDHCETLVLGQDNAKKMPR